MTVRPRSVEVALSPTITIPEWAEEQARAHARSLGWDYYVMRSNWLAFAHVPRPREPAERRGCICGLLQAR